MQCYASVVYFDVILDHYDWKRWLISAENDDYMESSPGVVAWRLYG